jgi:hypothetical protein
VAHEEVYRAVALSRSKAAARDRDRNELSAATEGPLIWRDRRNRGWLFHCEGQAVAGDRTDFKDHGTRSRIAWNLSRYCAAAGGRDGSGNPVEEDLGGQTLSGEPGTTQRDRRSDRSRRRRQAADGRVRHRERDAVIARDGVDHHRDRPSCNITRRVCEQLAAAPARNRRCRHTVEADSAAALSGAEVAAVNAHCRPCHP